MDNFFSMATLKLGWEANIVEIGRNRSGFVGASSSPGFNFRPYPVMSSIDLGRVYTIATYESFHIVLVSYLTLNKYITVAR